MCSFNPFGLSCGVGSNVTLQAKIQEFVITMLAIDKAYLKDTLVRLLKTPSTAGLTRENLRFVEQELQSMGFTTRWTRRGALQAFNQPEVSPRRGMAAHTAPRESAIAMESFRAEMKQTTSESIGCKENRAAATRARWGPRIR